VSIRLKQSQRVSVLQCGFIVLGRTVVMAFVPALC
jgi:hypothetical protein